MSKIILLSFFLFTSLFAEEFPFLGITTSTQSIDIAGLDKQEETTVGLRYGKQTLDLRTMFTYSYKNAEHKSFSMEIDKILMDDIMGIPEVRPYLGVSIGTLSLENDALTDKSGDFYAGHFGFLIYVTDSIDADLSFNYYQVDDIENVNKITGFTLGLHYFY